MSGCKREEFAFNGRSYHELAEKLGVPSEAAEIILDYGLQQSHRRWWRNSDGDDPDDCLISTDAASGDEEPVTPPSSRTTSSSRRYAPTNR